jgi:hypothetical protein
MNPLRLVDPSGLAGEAAQPVQAPPQPMEVSGDVDSESICLSNTGACPPTQQQIAAEEAAERDEQRRSEERARVQEANRTYEVCVALGECERPSAEVIPVPERSVESRVGTEEQETFAVGRARLEPAQKVAEKMEEIREVTEAGVQTTTAGATFVALTGKRITGGTASEEEVREAKNTIVINNSPLMAVGIIKNVAKGSRLLGRAEGVAVRGAGIFEAVARQGTRNPGSTTVVLGKFIEDGRSYTKVAAHYRATYLKVEYWAEVTKGLTSDEIWKSTKPSFANRSERARRSSCPTIRQPPLASMRRRSSTCRTWDTGSCRKDGSGGQRDEFQEDPDP